MNPQNTPASWEEEFDLGWKNEFINWNGFTVPKNIKNFVSKQIAEAEERGYQRGILEGTLNERMKNTGVSNDFLNTKNQ